MSSPDSIHVATITRAAWERVCHTRACSGRQMALYRSMINIEAGNLVNVTENMGRRRGDLAGLDLKEQKQQEPQ